MKIIEISGVSGVGKSYIISLLAKEDSIILDTTIEKEELSDLKLAYLFFKLKDSFEMLKLIIVIAFYLKITLFHKINFIRNSIKKIGKNSFLMDRKSDKYVVVDEGISHFYQNIISPNQDKNEKLIELIDRLILKIEFLNEIIIVEAPSEIIFKRLNSRGHKRLKDEIEIKKFIQKSEINLKIMKTKFPNFISITNIDKIDIKSLLSQIIKKDNCV